MTIHLTPSVGSVLKKMLAINPELGTTELIGLVRQAIRRQGPAAGFDFASVEIIDEEQALALARATLAPDKLGKAAKPSQSARTESR